MSLSTVEILSNWQLLGQFPITGRLRTARASCWRCISSTETIQASSLDRCFFSFLFGFLFIYYQIALLSMCGCAQAFSFANGLRQDKLHSASVSLLCSKDWVFRALTWLLSPQCLLCIPRCVSVMKIMSLSPVKVKSFSKQSFWKKRW